MLFSVPRPRLAPFPRMVTVSRRSIGTMSSNWSVAELKFTARPAFAISENVRKPSSAPASRIWTTGGVTRSATASRKTAPSTAVFVGSLSKTTSASPICTLSRTMGTVIGAETVFVLLPKTCWKRSSVAWARAAADSSMTRVAASAMSESFGAFMARLFSSRAAIRGSEAVWRHPRARE